MLVLSPERWGKDNQHTEYLQTADEHHQRAEPFSHIRQFAPRHGWPISVPNVGPTLPTQLKVMVMALVLSMPMAIIVNEYHQTDDEIGGEEGEQRNPLLHWYVHPINLQRQHGVRMQNLAEFILYHSHQHHATDTFQTSTRTARAGSEEHAGCQYHPGDMRPEGCIVVEKTGGGDERNHLEYGRCGRHAPDRNCA